MISACYSLEQKAEKKTDPPSIRRIPFILNTAGIVQGPNGLNIASGTEAVEIPSGLGDLVRASG